MDDEHYISKDCCGVGCLVILFVLIFALIAIAVFGERAWLVAGWPVRGDWLILPSGFLGALIGVKLMFRGREER
jgi:uncharacterized membrane protein HdeD (DUF308 family)